MITLKPGQQMAIEVARGEIGAKVGDLINFTHQIYGEHLCKVTKIVEDVEEKPGVDRVEMVVMCSKDGENPVGVEPIYKTLAEATRADRGPVPRTELHPSDKGQFLIECAAKVATGDESVGQILSGVPIIENESVGRGEVYFIAKDRMKRVFLKRGEKDGGADEGAR